MSIEKLTTPHGENELNIFLDHVGSECLKNRNKINEIIEVLNKKEKPLDFGLKPYELKGEIRLENCISKKELKEWIEENKNRNYGTDTHSICAEELENKFNLN